MYAKNELLGIILINAPIKINKIAKNEQILMITHLPQVAAIATNIIVGEKQVSNNVTISKLQQINKSDKNVSATSFTKSIKSR